MPPEPEGDTIASLLSTAPDAATAAAATGGGGDLVFQLLLLVVLIFFNAFFAMSEIAIITLNDSKLRKMAEDGHKGAKKVLRLTKKFQQFPCHHTGRRHPVWLFNLRVRRPELLGPAGAAAFFHTVISFGIGRNLHRAYHTGTLVFLFGIGRTSAQTHRYAAGRVHLF